MTKRAVAFGGKFHVREGGPQPTEDQPYNPRMLAAPRDPRVHVFGDRFADATKPTLRLDETDYWLSAIDALDDGKELNFDR